MESDIPDVDVTDSHSLSPRSKKLQNGPCVAPQKSRMESTSLGPFQDSTNLERFPEQENGKEAKNGDDDALLTASSALPGEAIRRSELNHAVDPRKLRKVGDNYVSQRECEPLTDSSSCDEKDQQQVLRVPALSTASTASSLYNMNNADISATSDEELKHVIINEDHTQELNEFADGRNHHSKQTRLDESWSSCRHLNRKILGLKEELEQLKRKNDALLEKKAIAIQGTTQRTPILITAPRRPLPKQNSKRKRTFEGFARPRAVSKSESMDLVSYRTEPVTPKSSIIKTPGRLVRSASSLPLTPGTPLPFSIRRSNSTFLHDLENVVSLDSAASNRVIRFDSFEHGDIPTPKWSQVSRPPFSDKRFDLDCESEEKNVSHESHDDMNTSFLGKSVMAEVDEETKINESDSVTINTQTVEHAEDVGSDEDTSDEAFSRRHEPEERKERENWAPFEKDKGRGRLKDAKFGSIGPDGMIIRVPLGVGGPFIAVEMDMQAPRFHWETPFPCLPQFLDPGTMPTEHNAPRESEYDFPFVEREIEETVEVTVDSDRTCQSNDTVVRKRSTTLVFESSSAKKRKGTVFRLKLCT